MNSYIALILAIVFEVTGTMLLPITKEFTKMLPTILVILFYSLSFYLLSLTVNKLPLAIVYASWAGLGVFSVAILSYFFYKQPLNLPTLVGLFLIVVGVILVNMFKTD
tara:strand:- start:2586 stop:2909 length:324 start_codon:yes stop_codon:yes gene_type:complete